MEIIVKIGKMQPTPADRIDQILEVFDTLTPKNAKKIEAFNNKLKITKLTTIDAKTNVSNNIILNRTKAYVKKKKAQTITGGAPIVAELLNLRSKPEKQDLLAELGKLDADLAKAVQKYMFTFEDLVRLTKEDLQKLIREVDIGDLVLAMKATSPVLMSSIVAAMSKRAAESLKEEIENLGAVKAKVVEEARDKIVATARDLEQKGQLTLEDSNDEPLLQ